MEENENRGISNAERTSAWLFWIGGGLITLMGIWMSYANSSSKGVMYSEFGGMGSEVHLSANGFIGIGLILIVFPLLIWGIQLFRKGN
jgi:hypothetical protein